MENTKIEIPIIPNITINVIAVIIENLVLGKLITGYPLHLTVYYEAKRLVSTKLISTPITI